MNGETRLVGRLVTDPRVVEVLAAYDRHARSTARDDSTLDFFMIAVADTAVERFIKPGGWSDEAIRDVLLAFLVNAPDEDLEEMVARARHELEKLPAWEAQCAREDAAHEARFS